MGVFISASTRILDRASGEILYGRVPAGSVVVPGTLPSRDGKYGLYCAVIVKQVDARTRAKTGNQRAVARRVAASQGGYAHVHDEATVPADGREEGLRHFLSVGSPINIKINGLAMPINQQPWMPTPSAACSTR